MAVDNNHIRRSLTKVIVELGLTDDKEVAESFIEELFKSRTKTENYIYHMRNWKDVDSFKAFISDNDCGDVDDYFEFLRKRVPVSYATIAEKLGMSISNVVSIENLMLHEGTGYFHYLARIFDKLTVEEVEHLILQESKILPSRLTNVLCKGLGSDVTIGNIAEMSYNDLLKVKGMSKVSMDKLLQRTSLIFGVSWYDDFNKDLPLYLNFDIRKPD